MGGQGLVAGVLVVIALANQSIQRSLITSIGLENERLSFTYNSTEILTTVKAAGRRLGASGIPSVLCRLEFKTVEEMDKVTSPLRSKDREEASREVILN